MRLSPVVPDTASPSKSLSKLYKLCPSFMWSLQDLVYTRGGLGYLQLCEVVSRKGHFDDAAEVIHIPVSKPGKLTGSPS